MELTHFDENGKAVMVDVTGKELCSTGQIEKTGRGRYRLKDTGF